MTNIRRMNVTIYYSSHVQISGYFLQHCPISIIHKKKKRQLFEINTTITSVHDKTDCNDIIRFFVYDYGVNGGLGVCESQRKKHTQRRWYSYTHHHHVPEGLGVFPVPWSSRWIWSPHLYLGRPMFLRPFGLYCSACFGSLFVSILCTCCSHFFWYCFISFTAVLPFFA